MSNLGPMLEVAAVGLITLALTAAMVAFGLRVIRQAATAGRADRRAIWRLTMLRVLVAILALSGAAVIAEGSFLAIAGLTDLPPWLLLGAGSERLAGMSLLIPLMTFVAASAGLYAIVEPYEVAGAARSFPLLRRVRGQARVAWRTWQRRSR